MRWQVHALYVPPQAPVGNETRFSADPNEALVLRGAGGRAARRPRRG